MRAALAVFALFPALHGAEPVTALAWSPDGKFLAAGGYREVVLWETAGGRVARRLTGLAGKVRALAFSPDGRMLAAAGGVAGRSGEVALLDVGGASPPKPLYQAKDEMLALGWSPDGKMLATGGTEPVVRIFTIGGAIPPRELKGQSDWITSLAFSPDGKLLASASADQTVRIWNPATWEEMLQVPQLLAGPVTALAFAPEGDFLAFAVNGSEEHAIRIWRTQGVFAEPDPARPNARAALLQTRANDQGACAPLALAFYKAPQHSRMIVGCADNTVRLLGQSGNPLLTGTGHTEWVYAVAASPDGLRLASGAGDGAIRIWSPAAKLLATYSDAITQP